MIGYHFTGHTLRNGEPIPAIGQWLEYEGKLVPCKSGLHASEHPMDALSYAPGPMLHKVELEGDLIPHGDPPDKWVGRRRRIIGTIDATRLLQDFARWCALQVIDLSKVPNVVHEYLRTGDEALRVRAQATAMAAMRRTSTIARETPGLPSLVWAEEAAATAVWAAARAGEANVLSVPSWTWGVVNWAAVAKAKTMQKQRRQFLERVKKAFEDPK